MQAEHLVQKYLNTDRTTALLAWHDEECIAVKDIFIIPLEMSSLGATLAIKMLENMTANSHQRHIWVSPEEIWAEWQADF